VRGRTGIGAFVTKALLACLTVLLRHLTHLRGADILSISSIAFLGTIDSLLLTTPAVSMPPPRSGDLGYGSGRRQLGVKLHRRC
jgi:hypothetical protein